MKLLCDPAAVAATHRRTIQRLSGEKRSLEREIARILKDSVYYRRRKRLAEKEEAERIKFEKKKPRMKTCRAQETASPAEPDLNGWSSDSTAINSTRSPSSEMASWSDSSWTVESPEFSPWATPEPQTDSIPSYMRETVASRGKRTQPEPSWHPGFDAEWEAESPMLEYEDAQESENLPSSCHSGPGNDAHPPDSDPTTTTMPDELWSSLMLERTREDPTLTADCQPQWLRDYAGAVRLPSRFVKNLYLQALEVASEVLYAWIQQNKPGFAAERALEGPWDLCLDRESLIVLGAGVRNNNVPSGRFFEGAANGAQLTIVLFRGIGGGLRNTYCHFDHRRTWPAEVWDKVYPVLAFAQLAGDQRGAWRAQQLLDLLRAEAEGAYAEIRERVLLSALPGAHRWEPHHERLFESVIEDVESHTENRALWAKGECELAHEWWGQKYGPAVLQAAFVHRGLKQIAEPDDCRGLVPKEEVHDSGHVFGYHYRKWTEWDERSKGEILLPGTL